MKREEKTALIAELTERLSAASLGVVTEYRGLTVAQLNKLRRELQARRRLVSRQQEHADPPCDQRDRLCEARRVAAWSDWARDHRQGSGRRREGPGEVRGAERQAQDQRRRARRRGVARVRGERAREAPEQRSVARAAVGPVAGPGVSAVAHDSRTGGVVGSAPRGDRKVPTPSRNSRVHPRVSETRTGPVAASQLKEEQSHGRCFA